jgi:hypothetical protein
MAGFVRLIWVTREGDSFFAQDWTGQISLKGLRNFLFARNGCGRVSDSVTRQTGKHAADCAVADPRLRAAPLEHEISARR